MSEANLLETALNYFECRFLFGDKQDPASPGSQARDQVSDRLALPRSRWPMDNSALVRKNGRYRSLLAGVGIKHQELIVRWNAVELSGIGVRLFRIDRGLCLTVTCECGDDVVYGKIVCT